MSTKFKTVITTAGAAKLAAATAPGGRKVNITTMAVGDGGGKLPVPDAGQTGLIHEVWRHALNKISQDKRNSNYIIAELVIPPEVGGFWMRELGLYDDAGTLIAVANMAESYKPALCRRLRTFADLPHGHYRQQCGLSGSDHRHHNGDGDAGLR